MVASHNVSGTSSQHKETPLIGPEVSTCIYNIFLYSCISLACSVLHICKFHVHVYILCTQCTCTLYIIMHCENESKMPCCSCTPLVDNFCWLYSLGLKNKLHSLISSRTCTLYIQCTYMMHYTHVFPHHILPSIYMYMYMYIV